MYAALAEDFHSLSSWVTHNCLGSNTLFLASEGTHIYIARIQSHTHGMHIDTHTHTCTQS